MDKNYFDICRQIFGNLKKMRKEVGDPLLLKQAFRFEEIELQADAARPGRLAESLHLDRPRGRSPTAKLCAKPPAPANRPRPA
jgi:hypothetical protein